MTGLVWCFITSIVHAQSRSILCGNEIFTTNVRKNYPSLMGAFDATFQHAQDTPFPRHSDPWIVNVVVHVVWNDMVENLDDSIIQDQIRVLNEDFNRLNADTNNLRAFFKPEAGSAGIQFHLAQTVRVQTDAIFDIGLTDTNIIPEVKHNADGGSDAWDPAHYLNIWVCKIQPVTIFGIEVGQVLGFAFPPNNLGNWPADSGAPIPGEDGVVIDYRVFGSNNPNIIEIAGGGALDVKGRTPVHEVGHYFGLRHIWGDGGLLGPNDCAQSDGIDDTPYADAQSSFDCDTTKNSCTQLETHYNADAPDLVENFMDYASETCMNMFTHGQVELMDNVLTGPRSGLLEPPSGVRDLNAFTSFSILPNPTEGAFDVVFELKEITNATLRVLNAGGQVIAFKADEKYLPGTHRVQFSGLPLEPGMYFVDIRNEHDAHTGKVIVY